MAKKTGRWYGEQRVAEINKDLELKMRLVTEFVKGEAKRRCPVDTGKLRLSISNHVERDEKGLVGQIYTDVDYAIFQEFGTSKMSAQPFMRPALEENEAQIRKFFQ